MQRSEESRPTRAARWHSWVAIAFVVFAMLRIVATYAALSETVDEVAHIGGGMEWLARGTYSFEPQHPPLARIAAAAGPYLLGIRQQGQQNLWQEGRRVLLADGQYRRNLVAARLGILLFFPVAAFFVWRIGVDGFGSGVALASVACFTLFPPILAHFGVATTDGPFVAWFAASMYAMQRWLRGPTVARGVGLGVASSLSLVTKYSAIPYLGLLAILAAAARGWFAWRRTRDGEGATRLEDGRDAVAIRDAWSWSGAVLSLLVGGIAGALVAWAMLRFSIGTLRGMPFPAPEILRGIRGVAEHNQYGHPAYFFGRVRSLGVWYFFPVMLLLKTPLSGLMLAFGGFALLVRRAVHSRDWLPLMPVLAAAAILAFSVTARINIGIRHILPIYLGLALGAGFAWDWAWRRWQAGRARAMLVGATALLSVGSLTVHPDYLAYFNLLAGRDPSRIVADSDLDWGQDLYRLSKVAREHGVDTLRFAYIGTSGIDKVVGLPVRYWDGDGRPTGWVAVSETKYRQGITTFARGGYRSRPAAFFWLDSAATFRRVGKGIRLYHIPPGAGASRDTTATSR
jgi:hypothetical protein